MKTSYPYWAIVTRVGRLPCPLQYKGTVIEKEFASGRLGGTKQQEQTTSDSQHALRLHHAAKRDGLEVDVYVVRSPRQPRHRLRDPPTELIR